MPASQETPAPAVSHPAPWLFGVLSLPYGFTNTVTFVLAPYLLRKFGTPVDQIASIVAVAGLPSIWSFFWSPLVDTGLPRSLWVLLSAVIAGVAGAAALLGIHGSIAVFTTLLFLMNALGGLLSSACGALMTGVPESVRGPAAGWYQAGNIGGGAIGGGLLIWLADRFPVPAVAVVIAVTMALPALAVFLIDEPAPLRPPLGAQMASLFRDMADVFRSRRTWLGLLFFLSPAGSAALANLISSVGPDYHAPDNEVLMVSGIAGGLLSALGCYLGGLLARRVNRMVAYCLGAALAAVFGAWLAFGGMTPFTYAAGYSAYAISSGISYAVYTALVLDVVGKRQHAAGAAYATLNACGNIPVTYMTWLDGVGYKHWGVRGLMLTDAVSNGGAAILLLLVAAFAGHHWRQQSDGA